MVWTTLLPTSKKTDFFEAPASAGHHLNVKGGLVLHSLNTCKAALAVWEGMQKVEPTLHNQVPRESVIIASLLHDVCKQDMYVPTMKRQKNDLRYVRGCAGLQRDDEKLSDGPRRKIACSAVVQRFGCRCRNAGHSLAHGSLGSKHELFRGTAKLQFLPTRFIRW